MPVRQRVERIMGMWMGKCMAAVVWVDDSAVVIEMIDRMKEAGGLLSFMVDREHSQCPFCTEGYCPVAIAGCAR